MKPIIEKITGNQRINKEILFLLFIGGLYSLSISLSNTFVNVFLWKQSKDFVNIALYNLAIVIMQPLTFLVAGSLAKRVDRIIVLRLGVIFLSIFYLMVLLFGEQSSQFILILGGLLGIGYGFYWLAFNVLTFEITEPDTRDFFNGFYGVLVSFTGMIGPITAGGIISNFEAFTGYTVIFSISFGLFLGAVLLSLSIRRRPAHGIYAFMRIFQERKHNRNWKKILHANFFQGLREGSFLFTVSIWVFVITNSEWALGTFGLVHSAVAFVCYLLVTKYLKPYQRMKAILVGGMLLYVATFLLIFNLTFQKLIFYALLIGIAYPIILVPYLSIVYDVIGKSWKSTEMRVEYIVVREVYLNLGRIVSILLFLTFISLFNEQVGIPLLLLLVGSGYFAIYFVVKEIKLPKIEYGEMDRKSRPPFRKRLADEEGGSTV